MALTWNQISGITHKKFIPKVVDNIFDSNPYYERSKRNNNLKLDGGLSIMQPLMYAATTSSGWYDGDDTLQTSDNEQMTSAEYQWRFAYANISIKRTDELKNMGDSQVVNFVAEKTQASESTLADNLGTAMWNDGSAAKNLHGLRHLLSTSNTVGGISQSSYSWWQAQVDSTSTVVTLPTLQTQYSAASIGNNTPTVLLSTRTIYDNYYGLLTPQQRFMDDKTAKAGFTSLMFNGRPLIVDSHAPANHLAMINEKYIKLVIHKAENFRFEPFAKPVNQNIKVARIYFAGNLISSNSRMSALFTGLTS